MSFFSLARRAVLLAFGVITVGACQSPTVVNNTNNFLGAQDVQFLCLEPPTVAGRGWSLRPTADCGLSDVDNGPTDTGGRFRLHAVVSQFQRGELALVDLATTEGVAIIDNSPSIPGYTFVPVDELPTAMVADVRDQRDAAGHVSGWLWLSSATHGTVLRVTATSLRNDPTRVGEGERATLALGGVATDLAMDSHGDQKSLVATLPDRGVLAVVNVTDVEHPGEPRFISLGGEGISGLDGGMPDAGGALDGGAVRARPAAVAIDSVARRAYVTDEVNPVVYVVDLDAGTVVGSFGVGVPARAVALTGVARAVTRDCDAAVDPDHCARGRYLYLVSAVDGSVRVWDVTRRAMVMANVLPAPNPERRRVDPTMGEDRVAIPAPAMAIAAVETKEYNPTNPEAPTIDEAIRCDVGDPCRAGINAGPSQLRGVYVAVALRDGRLSMIDVDDYEAPCRAATCDGADGRVTPTYRFVRHAPRSADALTDPPRLAAQPATTVLLPGSTTGQPVEPDQAAVMVCGAERSVGSAPACGTDNDFGVTLTPREVGASGGGVTYGEPDPYAATNDSWSVVYEGVLPGLEQSGGGLSVRDGALVLSSPGAAFCARGALANDRARDVLVIRSDPTPLAVDADLCAAVFGSGVSAVNRDFVIERAYDDRLVLRSGGLDDLSVVPRCFPQAVTWRVRAGGQWTVIGALSGFLPAVRVGADGQCEVDPVKQGRVDAMVARCRDERGLTGLRAVSCPAGRACTGTVGPTGRADRLDAPVFANPWFCFQIFPALSVPMGSTVAEAVVPDRDTQMAFSVTGAFVPWGSTAGTLLTSVRWVPGIDRLFAIDTQVNGLVEFRVNPFARGRVFN